MLDGTERDPIGNPPGKRNVGLVNRVDVIETRPAAAPGQAT